MKKIDYKDIETVFLTCMLHKETMKDTYDLKEILKNTEKRQVKSLCRKKEQNRNWIFL